MCWSVVEYWTIIPSGKHLMVWSIKGEMLLMQATWSDLAMFSLDSYTICYVQSDWSDYFLRLEAIFSDSRRWTIKPIAAANQAKLTVMSLKLVAWVAIYTAGRWSTPVWVTISDTVILRTGPLVKQSYLEIPTADCAANRASSEVQTLIDYRTELQFPSLGKRKTAES